MYVRTAGSRDVAAIRELLVETWHATYDAIYGPDRVTAITDKWHATEVLRRRLEEPNAEFLVADDGKQIAGVAFATARDCGKTVMLRQLYVRPAQQGHGIGGLLLDEIEGSFHDADKVLVEVEEKNTRAVAFYIGQGFSEVGRKADADKGGDFALLVFERPIVWAD